MIYPVTTLFAAARAVADVLDRTRRARRAVVRRLHRHDRPAGDARARGALRDVNLDDVRAAARAPRRRRAPHAGDDLAHARRRRARVPQVRELPARRRVQVPRRLQLPLLAGCGGAARAACARSAPATTRRRSRCRARELRHPRRDPHARGRAGREARRGRRLRRRDRAPTTATPMPQVQAGREFAERRADDVRAPPTTTRGSPPARAPPRSSCSRTPASSTLLRRPGRRRRADGRVRHRGQGAAPRRARDRRRGRRGDRSSARSRPASGSRSRSRATSPTARC